MKLLYYALNANIFLSALALNGMEKPTSESIKLTIVQSLELLGNKPDTNASISTNQKRGMRKSIAKWRAMKQSLHVPPEELSSLEATIVPAAAPINQGFVPVEYTVDDDSDDDLDPNDPFVQYMKKERSNFDNDIAAIINVLDVRPRRQTIRSDDTPQIPLIPEHTKE